MADTNNICVDLEGLEEVFRICGRQTGMAALDQRIAEFMKSTDSRIIRFVKDMEKYDKPRLQGSPGSENNKSKDNASGLNYYAPMKNLQMMLSDPWFDVACADKKKFSVSWRNRLIEDLMASECRDEVAKAWENKDHRGYVKGRVIGALVKAGVFLKKQYTPIARIYYGTREDTKETNTFAEYMGQYCKTYYGPWIFEYVTRSPIEK